jgi:hypothetical protein
LKVSGNTISWDSTLTGKVGNVSRVNNFIVRAEIKYDGKKYYAFYPLPIIKYNK